MNLCLYFAFIDTTQTVDQSFKLMLIDVFLNPVYALDVYYILSHSPITFRTSNFFCLLEIKF